jgi:pimeloyl-ACP methyl ester carboxylesterase
MAMTQTWIDVPGARLNVVDEGAGSPVVLLHAGVADLRAWDAMAPMLVTAGYRVVRYDARGFGATSTQDVPFSNRADLVAVLDALGIGRAALVGNSRGGSIAFDIAIEFPERVVAVIGVGAGLGGFDGGGTPDEIALFEEMDRLESADPPGAEAIADFNVRVWVDGPGQPETRVRDEIRDAVRSMVVPLFAPGHVDGRPIPLAPNASGRVAELIAPILVVAGTLDFTETVVTARYLEANAPTARAVVWDDVAHMIGMEQPRRLAETITAFLRPLAPWD